MLALKLQRSAQIDDASSIQMQRLNRSAAGGSQAEQQQAVFTPSEMSAPLISAWVKERNHFATDWIERRSLVVFGVVTALAGQREVVGSGCAAKVFGEDVIVRMFLRRVRIGAEAVFAMVLGPCSNRLSQLFWDALFSHAEQA